MNTSTFLQSIGSQQDEHGDSCFSKEPVVFENLVDVIVPLSHYAVLAIHGPDAEKFLQGQITCSATEVSVELSSPGAYCTVKGRVLASFQLLRPHPTIFWLRLRRDLLDLTARTFGKYIVFSKAKAEAADVIGIGLAGPSIRNLLSGLIGALPTQQNASVSHADGLLFAVDTQGTQFEYWGPAASAKALWEQCAPSCTAVGSRYWRWLQIRNGTAEIGAWTSETFLPHMLNYHLIGAINFKKGCYTGQEIVARTHYRGQVKRHLLRAELLGIAPTPGAEITDSDGKNVGNVVDSTAIGPEKAELLAVIADDASANTLCIGTAELRTLPLPYAIP